MGMPKISIITPCLNDARHVGQTLRSIHAQDYVELEHIVIDGGSTDGSVDIIQSYDSRLAYWCSQPDAGHADALNKGLRRATGEIVTWICSNDLLLPGSLRAVGEFFARHPRVRWAVGHGLVVDEESRVKARIWAVPFSFWSIMLWLPWGACQPAVFMRRSALEAVGGVDPHRHVSVDTDLFLKLARLARPARMNRFIGALRYHDDSQTNRHAELIRQSDEEIRRQQGLPDLPRMVRRLAFRLYDARFRGYQWFNESFRREAPYSIGRLLTV